MSSGKEVLVSAQAIAHQKIAHAALIRVHLDGGNQAEALAALERFRACFGPSAAYEPSSMLQALVKDLLTP